jgi:hypothetical protein
VTRAANSSGRPDGERHGDAVPRTEVLLVDEWTPHETLVAAAQRLRSGSGAVELAGVATLVPESSGIVCEICLDTNAAASRCEEEFKVLVENATRALARSRLAAHLPQRACHWRVVQDAEPERIQLWPVT